MPTATSTLDWTLANAGPAPTTYSVPTWCTESSYQIATATSDYPAWANQCSTTVWNAECGVRPTDSALAKEVSSNWYVVAYYSPGPSCPSGWKTVGAIARPSEGPVTSSGLFKVDDYDRYEAIDAGFPYSYQPRDVFGALLDPEETVIACCPSSMTVHPSFAGCYSTLPPREISTGCAWKYPTIEDFPDLTTTSFPLNGTTTTGVLYPSVPSSAMVPTAITTTFNASEASDLIPVSAAGPIYLVHKPSDVSDSESDSGSGTNAASTLRTSQSNWRRVMGALAVSLTLGMALVLPW